MSVPMAVGHRRGLTKYSFYISLTTREVVSFLCWLLIKVTAVKTNEKFRQIHQVHISEQRPPSSGSNFLCNCTDKSHFLLTQQTFMEHLLGCLSLDKTNTKIFPNSEFSFVNNFKGTNKHIRKPGRAPKFSTPLSSHSELGTFQRLRREERLMK